MYSELISVLFNIQWLIQYNTGLTLGLATI